jgi:hypothetical protein
MCLKPGFLLHFLWLACIFASRLHDKNESVRDWYIVLHLPTDLSRSFLCYDLCRIVVLGIPTDLYTYEHATRPLRGSLYLR